MDSAVRHRLLAATLVVPSVAMLLETKMPEEDINRRSSMAGKLILKICLVIAASGFRPPFKLTR